VFGWCKDRPEFEHKSSVFQNMRQSYLGIKLCPMRPDVPSARKKIRDARPKSNSSILLADVGNFFPVDGSLLEICRHCLASFKDI
jgi:hypothetical protein